MVKRRAFLMSTGGATAALAAAAAVTAKETRRVVDQPPGDVLDPTYINPRIDSRSISFENPTGGRGAGGHAHHGRKGAPFYVLDPGEKVVLADIQGPGTIRHIWTTLSRLPPEVGRALRLEVFYDGLSEPSISVPVLDFFGLPHGRAAEYYSALPTINSGRGLNAYIPMPFERSIRVELSNESQEYVFLFYQIDYTLEPSHPAGPSYLHVSFRRENPTTMRRDFLIAGGFKGPGRYLGCSVGIRVLEDNWYGEGEVKIYRDGDEEYPTYCGTGLEDYVGSAYGLRRHNGLYTGSPIEIPSIKDYDDGNRSTPTFVSFYRWHLPDPIMFASDLRVTIQQIGTATLFKKGQEADFEAYQRKRIPSGPGWLPPAGNLLTPGSNVERADDYCATAYVYCQRPQPVTRFDLAAAVRDIGLLPQEPNTQSVLSKEEARQAAMQMKRQYWGERR